MKSLSRWILITVALLSLQACVFYTTGPNEVGVRTRKLAIMNEKGVENRAYPAGSTFFFFPFINDFHTFDTREQNLKMTFSAESGDRKGRDDLLFKTIDGNDISLDVIVRYQIDAQKAPHILSFVAPNNEVLKEKIVRTIARSKPRDIFGELKTEEFYLSEKRDAQSEKARDVLQEMLSPMGVIVKSVLTEDYRFNEEYQKAIEDRKVADQLVERNKAARRAAEEEYVRRLEEAKGEVNKMVADVDGEYLKAKIEADAYFEKQRLLAEAIKVEAEAEAKGIQETNAAMALAGGEAAIKLKIAEALQGKRIVLLPLSEGGMHLKTTDVNDLVNTIGIRSMAEKQKKEKQ